MFVHADIEEHVHLDHDFRPNSLEMTIHSL